LADLNVVAHIIMFIANWVDYMQCFQYNKTNFMEISETINCEPGTVCLTEAYLALYTGVKSQV